MIFTGDFIMLPEEEGYVAIHVIDLSTQQKILAKLYTHLDVERYLEYEQDIVDSEEPWPLNPVHTARDLKKLTEKLASGGVFVFNVDLMLPTVYFKFVHRLLTNAKPMPIDGFNVATHIIHIKSRDWEKNYHRNAKVKKLARTFFRPLMTVKIFFQEECYRRTERWTFDELHDYARLRFFNMKSLLFSMRVRNTNRLVYSDESLATEWANAHGKPLSLIIVIIGFMRLPEGGSDDEVEVEEE
jgi:hypothetical protein